MGPLVYSFTKPGTAANLSSCAAWSRSTPLVSPARNTSRRPEGRWRAGSRRRVADVGLAHQRDVVGAPGPVEVERPHIDRAVPSLTGERCPMAASSADSSRSAATGDPGGGVVRPTAPRRSCWRRPSAGRRRAGTAPDIGPVRARPKDHRAEEAQRGDGQYRAMRSRGRREANQAPMSTAIPKNTKVDMRRRPLRSPTRAGIRARRGSRAPP